MPPPPKPAGRTAPPVPETQAAPKIIQEEVEFKPLRQSSGFGINIDLPKSLNATPEKEKVPAKPAVIEFSGQQAKPAEAPIRVVHYSEFRTPLAKPPESPAAAGTSSSAPKPSSGEREVHEVTAMPGAAAAPVIYGSTAIPPKPFASFPTPPTPQPMPAPKPFVAPPQSSPINFMKPAILPVPPVPPSQTPLPPKISVGFSPPPASKPVPPPAPFVPSAPSVSKPNPPVSNPLPHLFDEKELPPG